MSTGHSSASTSSSSSSYASSSSSSSSNSSASTSSSNSSSPSTQIALRPLPTHEEVYTVIETIYSGSSTYVTRARYLFILFILLFINLLYLFTP